MKQIHILGGGTFSHVRSHLAIATPAFGETARRLYHLFTQKADPSEYQVNLHLTKMADPHNSLLVTNKDVERLLDRLIADSQTKIIIFNVALTDFEGQIGDVCSGKYAERLQSRNGPYDMHLTVADKLIGKIRKTRKDIFAVAFKTTCGATQSHQYNAGLNLLKQNSVNLVLANDIVQRTNLIVCPEESYYVQRNREDTLNDLVEMTLARSQLTFTRSIVDPNSVACPWDSDIIPDSLRTVVDYCISRGAYKTFNGATVGHFAFKVDDNTFVTSRRKSNFNDIANNGMIMVHVDEDNPNVVHAFGGKPSVGGQSQRLIFKNHQNVDCIVHFHCPMKTSSLGHIPIRSQRLLECGSHQCGQNTSDGLQTLEHGIKAVFLHNHGPNIVFNKDLDPQLVINFIEQHFELDHKIGGEIERQYA